TGLIPFCCAGEARAQTEELPEIRVTAPTPIARRAPPRRAPSAAPPAAPAAPQQPADSPLQGTLPIVAGQFATGTGVPKDEIQRTPTQSLGDAVFSKPGITSSTFAPGASRPIVRGLDNYRVRVQENGLAVNDVSDLSEDHAPPIDPLAAKQIEVIR